MKKVIGILVAFAMIFALAKPYSVFTIEGDNPFNDIFPIDIPVAG